MIYYRRMSKTEQCPRIIDQQKAVEEQLKRINARSKAFPWWEMFAGSKNKPEEKQPVNVSTDSGLKATLVKEEWDLSNVGPLLIP